MAKASPPPPHPPTLVCTQSIFSKNNPGNLQGEDAVHDAIRQQQLAVGATGRILEGLREWGARNEEVLWAVLFSLAVLVRDGANPFLPAICAVAAAGIPPLLSEALQTYKVGCFPPIEANPPVGVAPPAHHALVSLLLGRA